MWESIKAHNGWHVPQTFLKLLAGLSFACPKQNHNFRLAMVSAFPDLLPPRLPLFWQCPKHGFFQILLPNQVSPFWQQGCRSVLTTCPALIEPLLHAAEGDLKAAPGQNAMFSHHSYQGLVDFLELMLLSFLHVWSVPSILKLWFFMMFPIFSLFWEVTSQCSLETFQNFPPLPSSWRPM